MSTQAQRWVVDDDEAVLPAADGRTHLAGAGRHPGGYRGWIWVRGTLATTRLVQTDTVPTLEDAMAAAQDLLRMVRRGP